MAQAIFCLAFFAAYTLQGVTGFAGNLFAMPVGIHTLGMHQSVAVLNAVGCLACGFLAFLNRESVNWRELGKILSVMLPFMLLGIWVDSRMSFEVLLLVYGTVVLAVGAYNTVSRKQRIAPRWLLGAILVAAGLIQGMFVSGGAFLVIYAIQQIKDKQQFRATLSAVWAVLNVLYAGISFNAGFYTPDAAQTVLICIPLAALATFVGNGLAKKVSPELFSRLSYLILIGIGVVLLATALS